MGFVDCDLILEHFLQICIRGDSNQQTPGNLVIIALFFQTLIYLFLYWSNIDKGYIRQR